LRDNRLRVALMGAPVGNTNGAKAKRWQKAIERALARSGGDIDAGLNPIADRLIAAATAGDKDAIREIGDRLDGKPKQSVDVDLTSRTVVDLDDAQLAGIVTADGGSGIAGPEDGAQESAGLHPVHPR